MDTTNQTANPSVIVRFPRFRSVAKPIVLPRIDEPVGSVAMSMLAVNDDVFTRATE